MFALHCATAVLLALAVTPGVQLLYVDHAFHKSRFTNVYHTFVNQLLASVKLGVVIVHVVLYHCVFVVLAVLHALHAHPLYTILVVLLYTP